MNINNVELAKIVSDFLFDKDILTENTDNSPEEKAKEFFVIKKSLTPHGFEKYMQYYFMYKKGYKVKLNGHTNQVDGCIDLKGIKKEDGKEKYLLAQCKRYGIKDISESMIREFGGALSLPKYTKYSSQTERYFITTSKFTYKALEYGKQLGIIMVDFSKLYKLQKVYSFEHFKNDVLTIEGEKEISKCLETQQLLLDLDDNIINSIQAPDREVFQLLKQIRRDISNNKQLRLGSIARNDTLELLSRVRPHNLEALKDATRNLSAREKNKIDRYGYIFIDRLKYLHKEDKHIEKKSGFKKFFKI